MTDFIDAAENDCSIAKPTPSEHALLVVDDDERLLQRVARAMEARGFKVATAKSIADSLAQIKLIAPAYALVDIRLHDGCGLDVILALKQQRPDARAIIHTGYGNIATAVGAAKLGAIDYLIKPADADDIVAVLLAPAGGKAEPPKHPLSAPRARWEHIQNVYEMCGGNVSEAARRLAMHRRTLQRVLAKQAPR